MEMETIGSLAVLGTGKMGGALVRGWVDSQTVEADSIRLFDVHSDAARELAHLTGAGISGSAAAAVDGADVILVSVKPHIAAPCLHEIRDQLSPQTLVISIAAGVRLATLEEAAGVLIPVVRVMPNTPALVGEGASAFCLGAAATDAHAGVVQRLLSAVGRTVEVEERHMDAVTGLSGSGPAYIYLVIEALADGGVKAGLPRDAARMLAAQTVLGAARMVLETDQHTGSLKDAVTTPGGTTITGLGILERAGMRGTLMDAVCAAADRSREMG